MLAMVVWAKPPGWVRSTPFESDPDTLRKVAEGFETDAAVAVLLDEEVVAVDAEGRRTVTTRLIWQLRDPDARDGWSVTTASWAPWLNERPVLKARVITPEGEVIELDPSTIQETGSSQSTQTMFDDRRSLRAPLPRITPGTVVEEVIQTQQHTPFIGGFDAAYFSLLGSHEDTAYLVRRAEVDASRAVESQLFGRETEGIEIESRTRKGTTTVQVTRERPDAWEGTSFLPNDDPGQPLLIVDTSDADWTDVGEAYLEQLGDPFDVDGLDAWVERVRAAPDDESRIATAYAIARDDVRYTGLEFGSAAILPVSPGEVAKRGYGDCKDKAALLVALLDAVDIEAHLALLRSGFGFDVLPDHVSANRLNHAIAYLPPTETRPAQWLDPTDALRPVDEVPWSDQGRNALVIDPDGPELLKTPSPSSSTARITHERSHRFEGLAGGRLVDVETGVSGWVGGQLRGDMWELTSDEELEEALSKWVDTALAGEYVAHEATDPRDIDTPYRVSVTADDPATIGRGMFDAVFVLPADFAYDDLPRVLYSPEPDDGDMLTDRTEPFVFGPHQGRSTLTVDVPSGFVPTKLPEPVEIAHGPVRFTQTIDTTEDQVTVVQQLDSGDGRMTPDEARAFRTAIVDFQKTDHHVVLTHEAWTAADEDRYDDAVALLDAQKAAHPDDPTPWVVEAAILETLGLRDAAYDLYDEVLERAPESAFAYGLRGSVALSDRVGRWNEPPMRAQDAITALEKSIELGSDDPDEYQNLIVALEYETGVRWGPGTDFEAIAKAAEQREALADDGLMRVNHALALLALDRCDEAAELAARVDNQDAMMVAAAACDDVEDAWREARSRTTDRSERAQLVVDAAANLDWAGRTRPAALLRMKTIDYAPNPEMGRTINTTIADGYTDWRSLPDKPENIWYRFLGMALEDPDAAIELMHPDILDFPNLKTTLSVRPFRELPFAQDAMVGAFYALGETEVEGNRKTGWRVQSTVFGGTSTFFVVRTDEGLRIRVPGINMAELGEEALTRSLAGDDKGARTWIKWALDGLDDPEIARRLANHPITQLRAVWPDPQDPEVVARLAAILTAESEAPEPAIPILDAWYDELDPGVTRRLVAMSRWSARYRTWQLSPSDYEWVDALAETVPEPVGLLHRINVRIAAGEPEAALEVEGFDRAMLQTRALALDAAGRSEEADALTSEAYAAKSVPPGELNNLAWRLLFRGPEHVELAKTMIHEASSDPSIARMHTAATAEALAGNLYQATRLRRDAAEKAGGAELLDDVWFVVDGLILHALGNEEAARRAFAQYPTRTPRSTIQQLYPIEDLFPEAAR